MKEVKIIGAGLAGCEAAWQLANHGVKVKLYEAKRLAKNPIQKLDAFAELVCSNTLRSKSLKNAVGILKAEMATFDSLILQAAYQAQIPGDDALAVDRQLFANYITQKISSHFNIEVIDQNVEVIDDKNELTLIATGPLTTVEMQNEIKRLLGNQKLFYLDASAPIIEKDSIDFNQIYRANRHSDDGDYLCVPLNEQQFNEFANELKNGQTVQLKEFEKEIFFKGCQPIEQLAKLGNKILLKGPMSPNNLPMSDGVIPYAVVQLRQDDAKDSLYNFVGFQTNLTWPEQARILSQLPGMEHLKIVRYGVMHKNYYINSPKILNHKLQVMRKKNVFFAGQITGVEGYVESTASGIVAAMGILATINNKKLQRLPNTTVIGALTNYITNEKLKHLNPMKANLGIVEKLTPGIKEYDYSAQSTKDLAEYIKSLEIF